MEPKGSLPRSQQLASGPHAQADEYSSPRPSIAFKIRVIIINLPHTLGLQGGILSPHKLCAFSLLSHASHTPSRPHFP